MACAGLACIVKPMTRDQIEMIAAREKEFSWAAKVDMWETLAASCFVIGACLMLALVLDRYLGD